MIPFYNHANKTQIDICFSDPIEDRCWYWSFHQRQDLQQFSNRTQIKNVNFRLLINNPCRCLLKVCFSVPPKLYKKFLKRVEWFAMIRSMVVSITFLSSVPLIGAPTYRTALVRTYTKFLVKESQPVKEIEPIFASISQQIVKSIVQGLPLSRRFYGTEERRDMQDQKNASKTSSQIGLKILRPISLIHTTKGKKRLAWGKLEAIKLTDAPKVNIYMPIPEELIENYETYKNSFSRYTYADLLKEYGSNLMKFEPGFEAAGRSDLFKLGLELFKNHAEIIKELNNSKDPLQFFPYQANSSEFKNYRDELKKLDKGSDDLSNELFANKLRALQFKYKKLLKHLQYGLIGIRSNGEPIMTNKQKKDYNKIATKIARENKLIPPMLVEHHIEARWTSATDSQGDSKPSSLDMPYGIIEQNLSNKVIQHGFLNNINEVLINYSLKDYPNENRADFSFGNEVFKLANCQVLNVEKPGKTEIPIAVDRIYTATYSVAMINYIKQERSISRSLNTYNQYITHLNNSEANSPKKSEEEQKLKLEITKRIHDFNHTVQILKFIQNFTVYKNYFKNQ